MQAFFFLVWTTCPSFKDWFYQQKTASAGLCEWVPRDKTFMPLSSLSVLKFPFKWDSSEEDDDNLHLQKIYFVDHK